MRLLFLAIFGFFSSANCNQWTGFYAGGDLFLSLLRGEKKFYFPKSSTKGVNDFGIGIGPEVGYLFNLTDTRWIFGIEGFGALYANKHKGKLSGSLQKSITIKRKNNIGIAGLGGIAINPKTYFYGKIGFEYNRFSMDYYPGKGSTISNNGSLGGVSPGMGVMFKLAKHSVVKAEYSFTNSKAISVYSKGIINVYYKPYIHTIKLGYCWFF